MNIISENPSENQNITLQKELLYFKDDILKDLKRFESKLTSKYNETQQSIEIKLQYYDEKIEILTEKISNISISKNENKALEEKIDNFSSFKNKIQEQVLTNEIKLDSTYKDLQNAIFKYDKMFSDTVIYPGIIGNMCKYKNFHEFMDYLIIQIAQLNAFKEKNILDLKNYKSKLDDLISSFKLQIDNITKTMTEFTTKSVNDCEDRIKNILKIYDDRLQDMRIENNKHAIEIKEEFEKMKVEWEKILQIKKDIYYRFDNEVSNMKESYNNVSLKFEGYKKEFNLIKNRFTQLSEFIKDVRFRVNLGNGITKRDALNLSNKIDFSKKQVYIEQPSESYKNIIKTFKKSNYLDNFINRFSKIDSGLIITGHGRKSVINPNIHNSFEKPNEQIYRSFKRQNSVGAELISKNFAFSGKFNSSNSFSHLNIKGTPNHNFLKNFDEDNDNKSNNNNVSNNKIIESNSNSEKSEKKNDNIEKNIKYEKISVVNNKTNEHNKNNNNSNINNTNNNTNNTNNNTNNTNNNNNNNNTINNNSINNNNEHIVNLSLGGEINFKNQEKNIRKKKIYVPKDGKLNVKFINSVDDNLNKKANITEKKDVERLLTHNKTYSIFPKIQNKKKEKLMLDENDKKINNPLTIISNSTRNEKKEKNTLNQKTNISNKTMKEESNIYNINGMEIVLSFENKIQEMKNKQKVDPYMKEIKLPDYNSCYNKYDTNNENYLFQKKQGKSDYFINQNKINTNKTQNFIKNQNIHSNSQEKGISDNYYYNLMVKEDTNKNNYRLTKLSRTHYGNLKKI